MKTILYNPIFINPLAYYVFPRLTRYLQPDNESTAEPANYIGTIEVKVIAYGDTTLKRTYTNTDSIDLSEFKNTWIRISLFTKVGSCVLGEWKIGNMESDLPYIDPEVLASLKAVVIVGNKTNNDSDRAIIKNLVDPDNPFIISNAAFKLNSGFGKYEEDFTDWRIYPNIKVTDSVVTTDGNFKSSWFIYKHSSESKINEMNIKVSGIPKGGKILYFYISDETANMPIAYTIPKDGIYHLPESKINNNRASVGFTVKSSYDWNNIRIEQIPSFEGAFVTDGVNDMITSTKTVQEMLGGSNEITVVSMIHLVQTPAASSEKAYTNQIRTGQNYLRNYVTDNGKTGIYGYTCKGNNVSVINNILGDKNDYTVENKSWNNLAKFSVIGYEDNGTINELDQVAWYWTIIANKVLTTDQINQVIAYYNLDRCVEPTVLYDVKKQGLSNDTPDSDWYLKDYSGNGYDMTLYNYAKTPESGINEDGGLQSDGVDDYGKVTGLPIYKDYTVVADYVRTFAKENAQDAPILSKSQVAGDGAFLFNYLNVNSVISSYSFGTNNVLTNVSDSERKIYYQSKYVNGGKSINSGTGTDYDSMWLGTYRDDSQIFFTGAIYSLMSFPYSMSEFLIERQLKKYKLGTLYKDMVEFRPIVKSNVLLDAKPTFVIRGTSTYLNAGDYVPENSQIWVSIKMNNIADRITKFTVNGKTIDIPENAYSEVTLQYGFPFVIDKSPQKISMTIEQDENYVQWNPIIESNVEYDNIVFYYRNERIENGTYLPIDSPIGLHIRLSSNPVNEIKTITVNGVPATFTSHDTNNNIYQYNFNLTSKSPQKINITIDEYIRYEDIDFTDCYPGVPRIYVNDKSVTWGDKLKVGDEFTFYGNVNILPEMYNVLVKALYNGEEMIYGSIGTISKSMAFTSFKTYIFDDNEPNCILSPRLLRIPNSSYKILGHIPDISGHGNHGVIHNSAYAEGSGVNEDGSYQFDGVDDFVTIPTITGGKQVFMKVNSRKSDCYLYDQRNNWTQYLGIVSTKDFIAYNYSNQRGKTYIDGILNENITANDLISITHNITVTNNRDDVEQYFPCIGTSFAKNSFAQMSLYDFMLFDNISTDDKIKELNEYVGIEGNT